MLGEKDVRLGITAQPRPPWTDAPLPIGSQRQVEWHLYRTDCADV